MSKLSKFIRTFSISPRIALSKAYNSFTLQSENSRLRNEAFSRSSYSLLFSLSEYVSTSFSRFPDVNSLELNSDVIKRLADNILAHRFNLLGSGWVNINKNDNYSNQKFRNIFNREESEKIQGWISVNYKPIDWQLDFKSGYRWDESVWFKDIVFGKVKGADIKVPWELGRMQHLPVLAYSAFLAHNSHSGFDKNELYINEFRNEILDFIAFNPPGFGVQWHSSMDSAIRAVNWIISYDLFISAGFDFDEQFKSVFIRSIYEHGSHISGNLEWSSGMRGNHYLADLAGLLFISSFLPPTGEINSWFVYSVCGLIEEIFFQFLPDGSNFEASTNYHFLSTEIVLYSLALILSLPKDRFNILSGGQYPKLKLSGKKAGLMMMKEHLIFNDDKISFSSPLQQRLNDIIRFSLTLINQKGEIPQIGDNDSGRFLKLTPCFEINEINELQENYNSHYNIMSIISALTGNVMEFPGFNNQIEYQIFKDKIINKIEIPSLEKFIYNNKASVAYKNFGLYLLKNDKFELFIRCGHIGQMGKGGHSHNDQLSFVLNVNNLNFIVDPGTYVYTSYPYERNKFRSVKMHNTLWLKNSEQNVWQEDSVDDLFWFIGEKTKSKVLVFDNNHFSGEHYAYNKPHRREIEIDKNKLICSDICNNDAQKFISLHLAPDVKIENIEKQKVFVKLNEIEIMVSTGTGEIESYDYEFSLGYGLKQLSKEIRIMSNLKRINWEIEIK